MAKRPEFRNLLGTDPCHCGDLSQYFLRTLFWSVTTYAKGQQHCTIFLPNTWEPIETHAFVNKGKGYFTNPSLKPTSGP